MLRAKSAKVMIPTSGLPIPLTREANFTIEDAVATNGIALVVSMTEPASAS